MTRTSATLSRRSIQSTPVLDKNPISILKSGPKAASCAHIHNGTSLALQRYTTARNAPASHPSPSLAALPDSTEPPPFTFAPAEFQRTCAPPEEELLVDSGFDRGDGEAECRRACATGRGRCWETMMARREALLIPFQAWLASSGFCAHAHVP